MGKLVVTEFVTLDGVAQAPGGPDEDRDSGFQHGGWQAPLLDESSGADLFDQAKDMDALLLGRRTFDIFANYWPNAPEEIPFTELLNRVPKYVASTTLSAPLAWDASLLEGDRRRRDPSGEGPSPARRASSAASGSCRRC